jgi:hypothetical protein
MMAIMETALATGDYRWNAGSSRFNLGLFRGLAGAGYTVLRRADDSLPNILIWNSYSRHRQVALRSSRVAKGRHERHPVIRYPGFGIIVTHETIRQWCLRFGQEYANSIRRRRPQPGDKWHLDEGAPRRREGGAMS